MKVKDWTQASPAEKNVMLMIMTYNKPFEGRKRHEAKKDGRK